MQADANYTRTCRQVLGPKSAKIVPFLRCEKK